MTTRDTSISHETMRENYAKILQEQDLPLVYMRQRYHSVRDTGLHHHIDHFAFYLVHSGSGLHEINGHPYAIARGDVYLTAPGSIHAYYDGENLNVDSFVFPIDLFLEEEITALRGLPGFRGLFPTEETWESHRLHLSPERYREVEIMTRQVYEELERSRKARAAVPKTAGGTRPTTEHLASEILARGMFFRLLVELARDWGNLEQEGSGSAQAATYRTVEFAEVLHFCEANFSQPISVPQLAARMFLSPSRFAEIFKKETGVPPAEYLRRLRLDRAQTLLKTSDLSATDIAQECGFSDAAQFSRAFKRTFGSSPVAYRGRFIRTG